LDNTTKKKIYLSQKVILKMRHNEKQPAKLRG